MVEINKGYIRLKGFFKSGLWSSGTGWHFSSSSAFLRLLAFLRVFPVSAASVAGGVLLLALALALALASGWWLVAGGVVCFRRFLVLASSTSSGPFSSPPAGTSAFFGLVALARAGRDGAGPSLSTFASEISSTTGAFLVPLPPRPRPRPRPSPLPPLPLSPSSLPVFCLPGHSSFHVVVDE